MLTTIHLNRQAFISLKYNPPNKAINKICTVHTCKCDTNFDVTNYFATNFASVGLCSTPAKHLLWKQCCDVNVVLCWQEVSGNINLIYIAVLVKRSRFLFFYTQRYSVILCVMHPSCVRSLRLESTLRSTTASPSPKTTSSLSSSRRLSTYLKFSMPRYSPKVCLRIACVSGWFLESLSPLSPLIYVFPLLH